MCVYFVCYSHCMWSSTLSFYRIYSLQCCLLCASFLFVWICHCVTVRARSSMRCFVRFVVSTVNIGMSRSILFDALRRRRTCLECNKNVKIYNYSKNYFIETINIFARFCHFFAHIDGILVKHFIYTSLTVEKLSTSYLSLLLR